MPQLLGLAGMQQWYANALAETWRDTPHAEEILAVGTGPDDLHAAAEPRPTVSNRLAA